MRSAVRCAALVAIAVLLAAGCASAPAPTRASPSTAPSGSLATDDAGAAPSATNPLRGRHAIAEPSVESLPVSLVATPGARALFAITQSAGERVAWVRRIDGASGAMGPLLRFVDEPIIGAFDAPDGGTTVVTSSARKVCVASFREGSSRAERRTCIDAAPTAIARLGDRLAMIELDVADPAPKRRAHVELRVRWATFSGDIDATTNATGLRFDRPLEGMTLIDAAPRAGALDLLFYEPSPARRTKSRMGSARLGVATLRADGAVDPASRRGLFDGDLEYGGLAGRRAPRLVSDGAETALVTSARRGAPCESIRVAPSLGTVATSANGCAIDPVGLASRGAAAFDGNAKMDALVLLDPRRSPGQARSDGPLVVWVGDRAWFVAPNGSLRSFHRASGGVRDERSPFAASRAHIAWSAIARDGEGIAFVDGRFRHLDVRGRTATLPESVYARLDADARRSIRAVDPPGSDRRHAARIGETWWIARGDVVRVLPDPLVSIALSGRAHADTTVLVGGASHGLFFEIAGNVLRVTAIDPNGTSRVLDDRTTSPVRAGFDAVERRRGGAIVVGPSDRDPTRAVALVVDRDGHASASTPIAITLAPGEGLHVRALPAGGAIVHDDARRRALWLDDDAREIAVADWPADHADVVCIDGEPARLVVPSPAPGAFVRVAELESACMSGDSTWTADGSLRWFGASSTGIDSVAEVGVVDVTNIGAAPPRSRTHAIASTGSSLGAIVARVLPAPPSACASDMVSIADRFCIDRYEASLVDAVTGDPLSPDYSATPSFFDLALADWATGREHWGDVHARAFPLPFIPASQRGATPSPIAIAIARRGARPNGYVQGIVAEAACGGAGKRLCSRDEFRIACRGEDDTQFPYGATFVDGACNVRRDDHPAAILHDNASFGHLDPRLDRVAGADGPLLRATGATPACRSRWGADAVYDLVGNIDEWIDDPKGAFAGGFFSRTTRAGCDAIITAHPKVYLDYSTGVRCCADAR